MAVWRRLNAVMPRHLSLIQPMIQPCSFAQKKSKKPPKATPKPTAAPSTPAPTTAPAPLPPSSEQEVTLALHNVARARHQVPNLVWDASLAASSAAWAKGCRFSHSRTGENLCAGHKDWNACISAWYNEIASYNYKSGSFSSAVRDFFFKFFLFFFFLRRFAGPFAPSFSTLFSPLPSSPSPLSNSLLKS